MDNYDYDNESETYTQKDLENQNQNIKDLTPSDIELEKNIVILQNAISLVKSQRLELEKETDYYTVGLFTFGFFNLFQDYILFFLR